MSRLIVLVALLGGMTAAAADSEPKPLRVLFLGDRGHHRPAERFAQLEPALGPRGIEIVYTEDAGMLDAARLAPFDCLLVYANITRIEPEQERGLLEYVASGGGFAPLHCASYCFLNSPAYIELVGAQFKSHGAGVFRTEVVDREHPITTDLWEFETWDETYVHTKHNEDRRVLQVRREGEHVEPWTWVRTHGKGRVFYTAYGHDDYTWGNPAFHALVERGLRWAAGSDSVVDNGLPRREGLKPFEFMETDTPIPNYLAGQRWGTQGEPFRTMQKPIEPAESMKRLVVPRGLRVELFASEPRIFKPISMSWDERGRLWILETRDYPNERQPEGEGRDQLKICEDTDGDGKADRFTIFADRLSIPTGLAFAGGGVIVCEAPDMILLRDTDGDDRADDRRVLFSGWGTHDTHAGPSNLRWGPDNWVWGMVGYSGFRGEVGGERLSFGQGFYRFRPDGSRLEFIRATNNNTWGLGFTEEGIVFGSTANNNPSVYMPIANRYYERVRGWSARRLDSTAASPRFYPITDKVRQVDAHGRFTAGAGHAIYTARSMPRWYWNRTAFVNGPTGHLTGTFVLQRRGSDFVTHNSWNLVASDDEWTAPIMAEVGPDGAVWVIDWYNYIVQHNPTPHGFETGKGNAYSTPLRDKVHGRIYRIVDPHSMPSRAPRLDGASTSDLVAALRNDNMLWRLHAQRLIVEGSRRDAVRELITLVKDVSVDDIGLDTAATHALWTLDGLGALDDGEGAAFATAVGALRHPSAGVRRAAVRSLPSIARSTEEILRAGAIADADAQVRLAAFLALADMPPSKSAGLAVAQALKDADNLSDRWLPHAITSAAATHDASFLESVLAAGEPAGEGAVEVVATVAEHFARGAPVDRTAPLVAALASAPRSLADAVVGGLARGWPQGVRPELDARAGDALGKLLERLSPGLKGQLIKLASRWGSTELDEHATEIVESLLTAVSDEETGDDERIALARQLVEFRTTDDEVVEELLGTITARSSPALATGIIEALGASQAAGVATALVEALDGLTPSVRPAAIRVLLSRAGSTRALLGALEEGRVQLAELSLDQKQRLAAHPDEEVAKRATALLEAGGELPSPDRQRVIDALLPVVEARRGDPARGKELYAQQCAKCHRHGSEGQEIGPDLTGMAAHTRAELLTQILDPSRSVEGNYRQYTVVLRDGRVLNGLLASETRTTIELFDVDGKKHDILREEILRIIGSPQSLMPAGFEEQMGEDGLVDLLAFLTQRGKFLPLPIDKAATITSVRGMFNSKRSRVERLVFPDWSPKTFAGVPFQLVDPRDGKRPNVIMLHGPQGRYPPEMPRRVTVPCNAPARAIHMLGGVSGWGSKGGGRESVSMIVRLHYADGETEDHRLRNAVHFADYIGHYDVPESKLAFDLDGRQIRYLAIRPGREETIERLELIKGRDATAPIVMAITAELRE